MTDYNPALAHWWTPEGTGEITRHWFRPVCNRDAERRKFTEREQQAGPPPGAQQCGLCSSIVNHPAGKGRAS